MRYLTETEINYIVSAIGSFRLIHNKDDDYTLEEYRYRIRTALRNEKIKSSEVVEMLHNEIKNRFQRCLLRPLTPSIVEAGTSIMAPIIQSVLNSHKMAGGKSSENSAREILSGALVRSNEHVCIRLHNADFDRAAYEKFAQEQMKVSRFDYVSLSGGNRINYVTKIPYDELLTDYNIFYPAISFTINIDALYHATLTPPMILKDLRNQLQEITVIGLHTSLSVFTLYFCSDVYSYINLLTKVKNVILESSHSKNKFTNYKIIEHNLNNCVKSNTDQTEDYKSLCGDYNMYYLDLKLVELAPETYKEYIESNDGIFYGYIYNIANNVVGIRYLSNNIIDFSNAICYRLRLYGVTDYFQELDERIDSRYSYSNNIYLLSKKLGIPCLISHFSKEWAEYKLEQNVIMYISAFMFLGMKINPIKHSSIAEQGPLSAMSESAKRTLTTMALYGDKYPITGPSASVAVGAPLRNSGITAIELV